MHELVFARLEECAAGTGRCQTSRHERTDRPDRETTKPTRFENSTDPMMRLARRIRVVSAGGQYRGEGDGNGRGSRYLHILPSSDVILAILFARRSGLRPTTSWMDP